MFRRTGIALVVLLLIAVAGVLAVRHLLHVPKGETVTIDSSTIADIGDQPLSWSAFSNHVYIQRCCATSVGKRGTALDFAIAPSDPKVRGSARTESRFKSSRLGETTRYRAVFTIPVDWQETDGIVIPMQWHGSKDVLLGEGGRPPPLVLQMVGSNWRVIKRWDASRISSGAIPEQVLLDTPFQAGERYEWVFDVHWATDETGFIRAWVNSEQVIDDRGPNAFNDFIGPYFKAGIYFPKWEDFEAAPDRRWLSFEEQTQES